MNNIIKNKGQIFAYDVQRDRLNILKNRINKLNFKNIKVLTKLETFNNFFDLIVCDVPCTGTGVWRRRPEDIIRLEKKNLDDMQDIQYKILKQSALLCKKKGTIVYITCSLLYDENEYQIKKFLDFNRNFTLVSLRENILKYFPKNMNLKFNYGFTLTPDMLNSDGYFISILKKSYQFF